MIIYNSLLMFIAVIKILGLIALIVLGLSFFSFMGYVIFNEVMNGFNDSVTNYKKTKEKMKKEESEWKE